MKLRLSIEPVGTRGGGKRWEYRVEKALEGFANEPWRICNYRHPRQGPGAEVIDSGQVKGFALTRLGAIRKGHRALKRFIKVYTHTQEQAEYIEAEAETEEA